MHRGLRRHIGRRRALAESAAVRHDHVEVPGEDRDLVAEHAVVERPAVQHDQWRTAAGLDRRQAAVGRLDDARADLRLGVTQGS